jgi:hypothetical protein
MKYLRQFSSESEYLDFKETPDFITPNVSIITDTYTPMYNEYVEPPISLCDIAYWDGSNVKTIAYSKWNNSLGTPIGVVVIPEGFLPDGKARMIGLKPVDKSGNASSSHVTMTWGAHGTDTLLTNFDRVPTTDNSGSTTTGSYINGYLPSDKFTGTQSFVDAQAKYLESSTLIPSPYLNNTTMNSAYSEAISGYNNALSDFNGLSNTQTLVGLGTDYIAANAAWKYSDGVSSTQWYLPAMGELGFLMPRFNAINAAITAMGGVAVVGNDFLWSSSEKSDNGTYSMNTVSGAVGSYGKSNPHYVRPFAML